MRAYRVGANVDSWCTRCKLTLAHTIEAVVGEDIKRVHCNTCQSKHAYRAFAPGAAPKIMRAIKDASKDRGGASPRKKVSVAGMARASDYEALMRGRDLIGARRYSFRDRYGAGDVVHHAEFGVGLVTADKGANKIEVLFNVGPKTLVHGRAA